MSKRKGLSGKRNRIYTGSFDYSLTIEADYLHSLPGPVQFVMKSVSDQGYLNRILFTEEEDNITKTTEDGIEYYEVIFTGIRPGKIYECKIQYGSKEKVEENRVFENEVLQPNEFLVTS